MVSTEYRISQKKKITASFLAIVFPQSLQNLKTFYLFIGSFKKNNI